MEAINRLPRPVLIGATIVAVLLACFIVFLTVTSDPNAGYGTKEQIRERQKSSSKPASGHDMPQGR